MRKSTIKLTKHELNFAQSTSYPLVKQQIVQKVGHLFQELGQKLIHHFGTHTLIQSPEYKITRGENYRNMPYMVLDFPRITGKDFPIVCRTLFWWGHYFSCSLLVHTSLLDLDATADLLSQKRKLRLCTGTDLWEHDLKHSSYIKLAKCSSTDIRQIIENQTYIKIACKIALADNDRIDALATEAYGRMLSGISIKKGA
jgi:hypothetical protein